MMNVWNETCKTQTHTDLDADTNAVTETHTYTLCRLTLGFGTDETRRRVSEGAQDGSDGQTQVLVTRVERHRGEAKVRQLGGLLRTDLHVRDLRKPGRNVRTDAEVTAAT